MLCSEENSSAVANVQGQQQQLKNSVAEEGIKKEEERGSSRNQEESKGEKVTTATDKPAGRLHSKRSCVLSWHFILDIAPKTCKLAICPCSRVCSLIQLFMLYPSSLATLLLAVPSSLPCCIQALLQLCCLQSPAHYPAFHVAPKLQSTFCCL